MDIDEVKLQIAREEAAAAGVAKVDYRPAGADELAQNIVDAAGRRRAGRVRRDRGPRRRAAPFAARPETLLSLPRVVQVWARAPGAR